MPPPAAGRFRVWINDFTSCMVTATDECGQQLVQLGEAGVCSLNTSSPLRFGKNADTVTAPGKAENATAQVQKPC